MDREWSLAAEDQLQLDSWIQALNKYTTNQQEQEEVNIEPLVEESLFTELSDNERINLKRLFQHPFKMHANGFIRIFKFLDIPGDTKEFSWKDTNIIGALVLVEQTQSNIFSFRILDPETCGVSWVYPIDIMNLNYEEETEYFHSFDGNKDDLDDTHQLSPQAKQEVDYRIGLSFSSTIESQLMLEKIIELQGQFRDKSNQSSSEEGLFSVRKYLKIFQRNVEESSENETNEEINNISAVIPGTVKHVGHVGFNSDGNFERRLPSEWISQNQKWRNSF